MASVSVCFSCETAGGKGKGGGVSNGATLRRQGKGREGHKQKYRHPQCGELGD